VLCVWLQLEFSVERNKVSVSNIEGYKKEITVLRDRLQKYTASIAKHEQTINTQRQVDWPLQPLILLVDTVQTGQAIDLVY